MRLALLADVHDNLPALEAVVEDIDRRGVDGIIAAGDYLVRGPFPLETMRLLRSLDAWMIRGNTDGYVLNYHAGLAPESWYWSEQWAAMRWTCEQVDRETLAFAEALPEERVVALEGVHPIRVVHGAPRDPLGQIVPKGDEEAIGWFRRAGFIDEGCEQLRVSDALHETAEPVLVCGHTHIPWGEERDGRLMLNPGAVSGSLNQDTRAQYAVLTWRDGRWQAEHRAVPYDLSRVRHGFIERGLLSEGGALARAFLLTIETGRNVLGPLFSHVDRLAPVGGQDDSVVVPDEIWCRAVSTFPWAEYS